MKRYNRLVKKGWIVITVDVHEVNGLYWTNVLMGKEGQRKVVRLDGNWNISALQEGNDVKPN